MRYALALTPITMLLGSVALADPTTPAQTPSDISHGKDVGPAAIRDKTSETRLGAGGFVTDQGGSGATFRAGNTGGVSLAPDRGDAHENGPALTLDVDARLDVGKTEKDGKSGVQRMELQFSPFTAYRFRGINRYSPELELRPEHRKLKDRVPEIESLYARRDELKKAVEAKQAEFKTNRCWDDYYENRKSDCADKESLARLDTLIAERDTLQKTLDAHAASMAAQDLPDSAEGLFRNLPNATGDVSLGRLSYEHRTDKALALERNAAVIEGISVSGHIATRIGNANIDFCGKISPGAIALGQNGVGDQSPEIMYRLRASGCVGTQLGEIAHLRGQIDFGLDASSVSSSKTVKVDGEEKTERSSKGVLATELSLTGAVDNIAGTGVGVYYQHSRGHSSDGTQSRDVRSHFVGVNAAF